jgi:hypothetical protein
MTKLVLLVVAIAACAVEPQDGSPAGSSDDVPRIIANSLPPSSLAGSALAMAQLTTTSAASMGATTNARKVLGYAVECALSDTQSVTFTVDGTTTTLTGIMGMVPAWTTRALTWDEAAWVSACVFARVNLTSTSVVISARGSSAGLSTTSGELSTYQVEEGAFWGNAFVDLGAITAYACNGVDQALDDSYGDLVVRQCAQWDEVPGSGLTPCGFHFTGACSDVCMTSAPPYGDCPYLSGKPRAQVVTTFLYGTPPYW